ncbi:MAG: hypothetical protein NVSMB32_00200 [Actinomycetota bacterium]
MKAVRRIAIVVALLTWLFCFSLLHDARAIFDGSESFGTVPGWLTGLLGLSLVLTIGTAITAAIRFPLWPWVAMAAGVFVFLAVIGGHLADLAALKRAGYPVSASLGSAFTAGFKAKGAQPIFYLGATGALVATGIYGWLHGPRTLFAPDPAQPSPVEGPDAA